MTTKAETALAAAICIDLVDTNEEGTPRYWRTKNGGGGTLCVAGEHGEPDAVYERVGVCRYTPIMIYVRER